MSRLTDLPLMVGLLLAFASCGRDRKPVTQPDTVPPAKVTDLRATATSDTSILLSWTAPGDDGRSGTAKAYAIRIGTASFARDGHFPPGPMVPNVPAPAPAESTQSVVVTHLTSETSYFFALRACDEDSNWSQTSNEASAVTLKAPPPPPPPDTTAPAVITNLRASMPTTSSITLTWTAPGDDGMNGYAYHYDLRYATQPIDAANFDSAVVVVGVFLPSHAGTAQTWTVTGLDIGTEYYFAIRTCDTTLNWSGLSNVAHMSTLGPPDYVAPAPVTDLVVTEAKWNRVTLAWTATGDDSTFGRAARYDLRYSLFPLTEDRWSTATAVPGEPAPAASGAAESFEVVGLATGTAYYFALVVVDEAGNGSGLSNVATATTIRFAPDIWIVRLGGGTTFPSIQAAIDAAVDGDEVQVGPERYFENLDFKGKKLTVRSEQGVDVTIIDGGGRETPVVVFQSGESRETVLQGFTITGADFHYSGVPGNKGSGIYVRRSEPTVLDCRITGNRGESGGGIKVGSISSAAMGPLFDRCRVDNNESWEGGGGVELAGKATFTRSVITRNTGGTSGHNDGGGFVTWGSDVTIEDCVISDNVATDHGGGLALWSPGFEILHMTIRNCVITGNQALCLPAAQAGSGGGIHIIGYTGEISNCTIAFNDGGPNTLSPGGGVSLQQAPGLRLTRNIIAFNGHYGVALWAVTSLAAESNILWGNTPANVAATTGSDTTWVPAQILADPLFCAPDKGDYRVSVGSPALTGPQPIGAFPEAGCQQPQQ